MIWFAVMYVWAGVTIGRMVYEFDVFANDATPRSDAEAMQARGREIRLAWAIGMFWPMVLPYAVYVHAKTPRP